MNAPLGLRLMTPADLAFADSVRASVGWNQTFGDWSRFLATEPDGCFLAEWKGAPAGTATTTIYSPELAWIGMVLVHPEYRRRGIGRALLEHCIEYLRGRGVRCVKLDATPLGKEVYDALGFREEWTLTRWTNAHVRPASTASTASVSKFRNWQVSDAVALDRLDTNAFGVSRQRILPALARHSRCALILESEADDNAGYGLLREGSQAHYLGPVVANSASGAFQIVEALLTHCVGESVLWDIPDPNTAATEWAGGHGFTSQRRLTRMYLGENTAPGDPGKQFALAGPEIG